MTHSLQPCPVSPTFNEHVGRLARSSTAAVLRDTVEQLLRKKPDLLRTRVRYMLDHPEQLKRLAASAYVHSNGFVKLRVWQRAGFCLRLHVWLAGSDHLDDQPHGHRWPFASWIAAGEGVHETLYVDVVDAPPAPGAVEDYIRYDYGHGLTVGRLKRPRPARLRVAGSRDRLPGEVYACAPSTIHTIGPAGTGLVATVVLQGPELLRTAPVYSLHGRPPRTAKKRISVAQLRSVLEEVNAAIEYTSCVVPTLQMPVVASLTQVREGVAQRR